MAILKVEPIEFVFNIHLEMAHPKIIIPRCFSNRENITIPTKLIHNLSQLNFDGEGETSILEHILRFLNFCDSNEVNCEDDACKSFSLTLEGHVKYWCHTLLVASIHSFRPNFQGTSSIL